MTATGTSKVELLDLAAERASRYLENLNSRSVFPSDAAVKQLAELGGPPPANGIEPAEVLRLLDEFGSPATVATAGPRYFGFVIGGASPATLAANWLAGAWDQNAGLNVLSPVSAELEEISSRWLLDILGLPAKCGVGFVTGATMANFTCLAAARNAVLAAAGWDAEAEGLIGAPNITVIGGEEIHISAVKAIGMLGLGRNRIVRVPTDSEGRMRADLLPRIAGPTIVCIQAGNVNSGAFDPASEICDAAHAAGAWVHVDAAFGLWAAAVPKRAHLFAGFAKADSWATDAHKWLNVPHDSGIAFVRSPRHLNAAMAANAAYLVRGEKRDPNLFAPEMSRRARGVEIWAALRSMGRKGLEDLIDRNCRMAERFAEGLRAAGYEILNEVVLNQVLVSFGNDETTRDVIAALQEEGTCWCGGTVWHGRTAMRIAVSSWATTDDDVDRSLEAMIRVAAKVKAGNK
jgi:glutamate/tyrosine decarboxylase-like PLP-dependent enzyme